MLVVVLVYQQVENNILTPKIQGKAVNLSGFFIIVAVTLFGALLGVLGALTAVPLAATIQIFVQELTKARREKVAAARAALEAPHPTRDNRLARHHHQERSTHGITRFDGLAGSASPASCCWSSAHRRAPGLRRDYPGRIHRVYGPRASRSST